MIETALGSMVCPLCLSPVKLAQARRRSGEVRRGKLVCTRGCHSFLVVAGIPIMLPPGMLADWTHPFTRILVGDFRLSKEDKRRMVDPLGEYVKKHGIQKVRDILLSYIKGEYEPPESFWDQPVDEEMIREGAHRVRQTQVERHLRRIEKQCRDCRSIREQARCIANLRPRRLLDVCCGGGFLTGWLLKTYRRYEAMFALDVDYNCAKRLEGTFRHYHVIGRSTPLVADVRSLPFPTSSFDVVSSRYGASHVAGYSKGLAEIYRMLRPGGSFVSTNRRDLRSPHKELYTAEVVRVLERGDLYVDKEHYLETLREAGFSVEDVEDIDGAFLVVSRKPTS